MKSLQCTVTIGTTSGYYHNNEYTYEKFFKTLQNYLENRYDMSYDNNKYISFVAIPSQTFYAKKYGCPESGERTCTLQAVANPAYVTDLDVWRDECLKYIYGIKETFKQITATVAFSECDVYYLK